MMMNIEIIRQKLQHFYDGTSTTKNEEQDVPTILRNASLQRWTNGKKKQRVKALES